MAIFYAAMVGFCLFGSTLAQITSEGQCPNITQGVSNIDVKQLSNGSWYQVGRYPTRSERSGNITCNRIKFQPGANGSIDLIGDYNSTVTGQNASIVMSFVADKDDPSLFHTVFPISDEHAMSNCSFLALDYDNYHSAFCCSNLNGVHQMYVYVCVREGADKSMLDKAYESLDKNNIDTQSIVKTDQKDCGSSPDA